MTTRHEKQLAAAPSMGTRLAFRLDSRRYHAGVFHATVALTRAKNVPLCPSLRMFTDCFMSS